MNTRSFREGGLTTLVGVDDQVDQNDYGASVGVTLSYEASGEITQIALYSTETGSGSVQAPVAKLFILDADPAIAAGDTTFTAADITKVIGVVFIAAADWIGDSTGKVVYKSVVIPFHKVQALYFVLKNEDAAGINDAGGDNEIIQLNFWYCGDR